MPKRNRTGLSQWVAEAAVPMLVLDRRSRVRVFNRGAQTLLGREAGEVLGQRARFTSDPDVVTAGSLAQQLAAIAPEPGQFQGAVTTGEIVLPIAGDVVRQQAVFVPLQPSPARSNHDNEHDNGDNEQDKPADGSPDKAPTKPPEEHLLVLLLPPHTVAAPRPASAHGELASRRVEQFHAGQTHRIVAASPAMQKPLRQLTLTRRTDASVHISGPPGSGRRTLARQVHADSLRAEQPLVIVSIARPLQPSQLREIRRSLQVDPGEQRPGTLILADIDRLPRDAQRDLLDWLTPDDDTERPRLVTTATRSLAELAADPDQPLRDDLAAELGTIGIRLPPLRERAGDLPLLAQAIIERELHRLQREQPASISPAAMAELAAHDWPGHVGELDRCLTAAVAACETAAIQPDDLPLTFRTGQHASALGDAVPMEPIQAVLDAAERAHIQAALARSGGRKAGAARLLGMTRPKLYRRLDALGLTDDDQPDDQPD